MFYIAKQYNISKNNIIAFGDEHNDQEMLDAAGRGVAMRNAIPSIKKLPTMLPASTMIIMD